MAESPKSHCMKDTKCLESPKRHGEVKSVLTSWQCYPEQNSLMMYHLLSQTRPHTFQSRPHPLVWSDILLLAGPTCCWATGCAT